MKKFFAGFSFSLSYANKVIQKYMSAEGCSRRLNGGGRGGVVAAKNKQGGGWRLGGKNVSLHRFAPLSRVAGQQRLPSS
jgi:hypothetical protein